MFEKEGWRHSSSRLPELVESLRRWMKLIDLHALGQHVENFAHIDVLVRFKEREIIHPAKVCRIAYPKAAWTSGGLPARDPSLRSVRDHYP